MEGYLNGIGGRKVLLVWDEVFLMVSVVSAFVIEKARNVSVVKLLLCYEPAV